MKCVKCNYELERIGDFYTCTNPHCTLCGDKNMWQELIRIRKENEDKQAVLNCVVDMLKTLNQRYTLIMGKDVIKETVRLLEQKDK